MKLNLTKYLILLGTILPALAGATTITEEDFKVNTTRNLINLCTASSQDPHYGDAIHFCHGYLVGAFHYYRAEIYKDESKSFICFPEPKPSRNEAIDLFIAWAQTHPQYMSELPVETEFRFLAEQWPCKK